MITIILFIAILGVLIFVHELGHFVTARRNGVKADEFGFGFPPRMAGFVRDEATGKFKFVWGNKDIESKHTVYSINWIPLGGFVKIKGEDGSGVAEPDSFAAKKAWPRIKILAAGVVMNLVFAWFAISLSLMIGAPEAIDYNAGTDVPGSKIQISQIMPGSPAERAGLKIGDEIVRSSDGHVIFGNISDFQNFNKDNRNKEVAFNIKRGDETILIKAVPEEKDGQGVIGVSLVQTVVVKYPVYQAVWKGAIAVYDLTILILVSLGVILAGIFTGHGVGADVSGPIGIAILTKQVAALGFVHILQFAAMLSINLAIINALPIPALDGGRILFILIEKIKGSPISQKAEQSMHTVGFMLLILLMIAVTLRDVFKFIK
ncbi:MAG: RIP metalloprotease RseP [Candidatus Moranbacteria bacterium]|nr:RIP metalloprotease RseP [Candidatus Moranbacteria bacterium]MDZ4385349.1 RIP metalloprotease RseP [Candidatus Moranbacteria bacterium]